MECVTFEINGYFNVTLFQIQSVNKNVSLFCLINKIPCTVIVKMRLPVTMAKTSQYLQNCHLGFFDLW